MPNPAEAPEVRIDGEEDRRECPEPGGFYHEWEVDGVVPMVIIGVSRCIHCGELSREAMFPAVKQNQALLGEGE